MRSTATLGMDAGEHALVTSRLGDRPDAPRAAPALAGRADLLERLVREGERLAWRADYSFVPIDWRVSLTARAAAATAPAR